MGIVTAYFAQAYGAGLLLVAFFFCVAGGMMTSRSSARQRALTFGAAFAMFLLLQILWMAGVTHFLVLALGICTLAFLLGVTGAWLGLLLRRRK